MAVSTDPHCDRGADECFGCRVRYWRRNGSPLSLPTHFRAANEGGYTQSELARETVAAAKRDGREIERVR